MIKENDDHIYCAWRKFEAHQIPVTEEAEYRMMQRWNAYKAGWIEALKQPKQRNFCERCGKRANKDPYHIHTCTPPQALEQPAQEPYAYAYVREDGVGQLCWTKRDTNLFKDVLEGWKEIPLYTHHAPSWQGLSDDEILELKIKHVDYELFDEGEYGTECNVYVDDFYHAIEQTLKEKNYGSV